MENMSAVVLISRGLGKVVGQRARDFESHISAYQLCDPDPALLRVSEP